MKMNIANEFEIYTAVSVIADTVPAKFAQFF